MGHEPFEVTVSWGSHINTYIMVQTVAKLQFWSRNQIILWLGVTAWGTVSKGPQRQEGWEPLLMSFKDLKSLKMDAQQSFRPLTPSDRQSHRALNLLKAALPASLNPWFQIRQPSFLGVMYLRDGIIEKSALTFNLQMSLKNRNLPWTDILEGVCFLRRKAKGRVITVKEAWSQQTTEPELLLK